MKWFRLYNETVQDRKLRRLPAAHRWLWIAVLCAASESEVRGKLLLADGEPVTPDDLADMAALPLKDVNAGLKALLKLDMIAYDQERENVIRVPKWDTRQHKSDNSTQRWREWKEKQPTNDDPTLDQQATNVGATYPPTTTDTDTDTEAEAEAEAENSPVVSPNGIHAVVGGARNGTTAADLELSPAERRVISLIKQVRGMASVPDRDIALHLREALSTRGSPLPDNVLMTQFMNFRDHWNEERKTQPPNRKWTHWRKAITNWIKNIRYEPPKQLASQNLREWTADDDPFDYE